MRRIVDGPSRDATPNSQKGPNRTYVFVVTALAVFLVGLIVWRSPVFGYVATVVVELPGLSGATADELRAQLADETLLISALKASDVVEEDLEDAVAELQRTLRIEAIGAANEATQFRVSLLADTPTLATGILGRVVNHRVATPRWRATPDDSNDSSAPQPSPTPNESIVSERQARAELDQHVSRVFDVFVHAIQSLTTSNHDDQAFFSPLISIKSTATLKEIPRRQRRESGLNPQWLSYDEKIKPLLEQYETLLDRRTEEHPEVKQLKSRIDLLTQTRDELPKTIDSKDDETADEPGSDHVAPTDVVEQPGPLSLVINPTALAASIDKFAKLSEQYQQSREAFHLANNVIDSDEPDMSIATMVEPPRIASRIGGTPSPQKLLVLGVLACVAGVVAAWQARWRELSAIFRSCDQVERELNIPVAGVIATSQPIAVPAAHRYSDRLSIGALRACESILAIIVVVIVFYTVFDSPFASDLVGNPIGTISQIVGRPAAG